jgi:hypothetical protein
MKYIHIPVAWPKEEDVDFEALGIEKEYEYEYGYVFLNSDFIESFNSIDSENFTIIRMSNQNCFKTTLKENELIKILSL